MKVISLGMGQNIFEESSAVRQRQIEYGKIFDELHLVVFTPGSPKFENKKLSENVFLYPTKSKSRILYILDFFKIVKNLLNKSNKRDFVLTVQDPFELGIVGVFIKLIYKLPIQIQIHTDFANKYFIFHSPLNFLRFLISHVTLSFADSVRVVSSRIAKNIQIDPQYLSVLPIIVNHELRTKNYAKENAEKIVFLTVARLEKEKDLETAIKAFKKVVDKLDVEDPELSRGAEFVIVGDGSQKKSLESKVRNLDIENRVKFVGWQNDLNKFYEEADIYISTSLYEGYGMSVVEAALHGLSLVLSDTGVAGEVFFSNQEALVCKQRNVDDFAKAMLKLVKDFELRVKIGQKARESALKSLIGKEEYLAKYKESLSKSQEHFQKAGNIFKKNILFRYLVSGFTGAGTQIGSLYLFTDILGIWYLYSSIFSFLIAIIISFLLQKLWTFGDREVAGAHHQFMKYVAVAVVGIVTNTCLMYIFVDVAGIWYIFAQIIAGGVIAVFNFLAYKFFVFKK